MNTVDPQTCLYADPECRRVVLRPPLSELSSQTFNPMADAALAAAFDASNDQLVVDLSDVGFLNSACLAILIQLKMQLVQANCQMAITGCKQHIASLFKASRLDVYLGVKDTA